jgi:flagellar protein FlaG
MEVSKVSNITVQTSTNQSNHKKSKEKIHISEVGTEKQYINDKKYIENALSNMNKLLEGSKTSLRFKLHEGLNEYYVEIIDEKTNEIVKEVPPKKLLDIYSAMNELWGILFDEKV